MLFAKSVQTVLPLHVEPQPCKQDDVRYEDDGVGPPGAVKPVIGEGVEHRRGEELQRVGGDVQQDVGVPGSQSRKAIIRGLERWCCANWDSKREPENRVNNHQG